MRARGLVLQARGSIHNRLYINLVEAQFGDFYRGALFYETGGRAHFTLHATYTRVAHKGQTGECHSAVAHLYNIKTLVCHRGVDARVEREPLNAF